MNKISLPVITMCCLLLLTGTQSVSQVNTSVNGNKIYTGDYMYGSQEQLDYKITASTNSYLEIEFYPRYSKPEKIKYNNEEFIRLNFENGFSDNNPGKPDIMCRVFNVILPSEEGNSVTVIDYDINKAYNINLAPVLTVQKKDPNRRDFDNELYKFVKNSSAYSQNKFLPGNIALLKGIGPVRDIITGSLTIHPYQYNPVSGELQQYTRIKVRVNFGRTPAIVTRKRSREEISLLKGIAVNSETAFNWVNPNLAGKKEQSSFNSVMSTGDWYRIEIKDNGSGNSSGIYKMSKSFLENAGINLSGVNPKNIKMYGNGGGLLPEDVNDPRPQDLNEIAVYIEGEDDGHFDQNDYILFYGKSVNNWKPDNGPGGYKHYINYYTNSNYYWIRLNTSGLGKRMTVEQSLNSQNVTVPASFLEKLFFEPERNNLILEGNLWLSERLSSGQSIDWNNTLTGLVNNSEIIYKIKPACHVYSGTYNYMLIKEDNSVVSPVHFTMYYSTPNYGNWIWTGETSFTINQSQKTNGEQSSFKGTYYCSNADAEGYLDWMEIHYKRRFGSVKDDFLHFYAPDISGIVEYNISPFSNNQIKIFEATQHDEVIIIHPLQTGTNSVKFQRMQNLILNEYFVIGQNGYKTPTSISQKIPNQNLHGAFTSGGDFIIITHKDLLHAANSLKEKRESPGPGNPNYLKTYVFTTEQIYNEFSGGLTDAVAIRDFLKYCFDTWQVKPVYVCMFGDGHLDYRNILTSKPSLVPPYENTDPFINEVNNYTSDDFFADVIPEDSGKPDFAIGRIPVNTMEEANNYLAKINCYEDPAENGNWKNKAIYVADDAITTGGQESSEHTRQSEDLAENHTPRSFEKIKLYLVLYPTVITSQGRRKPGVNSDIIKYWNQSAIAVNYTGHGSPDVWAHEYVFEKDVAVSQLNNTCRYPFLTVASCDFSKFDNPLSVSGGELTVTVPQKGAIGSLAATRPTYGSGNTLLNNAFWNNLYFPRDTLLLQKRFGWAAYIAKNQIAYNLNARKFVLLADPTIRTQMPRYISRIDTIEGLNNDTMRALSKIIIRGSILKPDSSVWGDYNGRTAVKIYDVTKRIQMYDEYGTYFSFNLPGGIIYSGSARITDGKWRLEFIVPKDISYLNKNGKILNYFYNNHADGSGFDTNFFVGGINQHAAVDTTGPDITLFLNNRSFRSGDIVNPDFKLIADFFDLSGINTTGTIGHKIEAVIDNNEDNKYDLTNFYNSDTTYRTGSLEYDFSSIAQGKHSLKLKAWDTYNNSTEEEIEFTVSDYTALRLMNVYNYPNPFKDRTAFTFQHNYSGTINTSIKIYTVSGRLIKEINRQNIPDKFVVIDWNGTDQDGERLANGVYLYKLIVTADDGNSQTTLGKLAVLK